MSNLIIRPLGILNSIVLVIIFSVFILSTNTSAQENKPPIEKEGLLRALRRSALTSTELINEIKKRGVAFQLTASEEREIRREGRYLESRELNRLIIVLRESYRPKALKYAVNAIEQLTSIGTLKHAAISPDGRYVVYVVYEKNEESLYLMQLATRTTIRIIPPEERSSYMGLTFSPNSNFVYYIKYTRGITNEITKSLYRKPVLGGISEEISKNIETKVAISPDGQQLAFVRWFIDRKESALVISQADGSEEKVVKTFKSPFAIAEPAWSPDGRNIVFIKYDEEKLTSELVVIQMQEGKEIPIPSKHRILIFDVVWLSNSDSLIMSAQRDGTPKSQLWQVSYPSGETLQLTNDTNDYQSFSITSDSSKIVTVKEDMPAIIRVTTDGEDRQVLGGSGKYKMLSWASNNHIIYQTEGSGLISIWGTNLDGSDPKQLTQGNFSSIFPVTSPNASQIFFIYAREKGEVWKMNLDGGDRKQILPGQEGYASYLDCSPDGQWLVYVLSGLKDELWKVSVNGTERVWLTRDQPKTIIIQWPVFSPDGKFIAYERAEAQPDGRLQWKIVVANAKDGTKVYELDMHPYLETSAKPRWSVDGKALIYVANQNEVSNLWSQPIAGGSPSQITNFKSDFIVSFDWSPDRKHLAYIKTIRANNILLLRIQSLKQ